LPSQWELIVLPGLMARGKSESLWQAVAEANSASQAKRAWASLGPLNRAKKSRVLL